jgi:hypothetical protein
MTLLNMTIPLMPLKKSFNLLFFLSIAIWLCTPANAALLIDPGSGSSLFEGASFDSDGTVDITPAGFNGLFYGQSVSSLYVAENGNLNFSANAAFFPLPPFTPQDRIARIAPLWDDVSLLSGTDNAVINHSVPGHYLAVTWKDVRILNDLPENLLFPPSDRSFQVVWFEQDSVIQNTLFRKDDIVFTYVGLEAGTRNFGNINALVGVTNGTSFTPLFGDADGFIQAPQTHLLAWEGNTYLRFRPTVDGSNYIAEKLELTAVPEPPLAIVACFATAVMSVRLFLRRRIQGVV